MYLQACFQRAEIVLRACLKYPQKCTLQNDSILYIFHYFFSRIFSFL